MSMQNINLLVTFQNHSTFYSPLNINITEKIRKINNSGFSCNRLNNHMKVFSKINEISKLLVFFRNANLIIFKKLK